MAGPLPCARWCLEPRSSPPFDDCHVSRCTLAWEKTQAWVVLSHSEPPVLLGLPSPGEDSGNVGRTQARMRESTAYVMPLSEAAPSRRPHRPPHFWTLRPGSPPGAHLCREVSPGTCWRCRARPRPAAGIGGSPGVPCTSPGRGPFPPAGCAGRWWPGMLGRTGCALITEENACLSPPPPAPLQHGAGQSFLPIPRTDFCGICLQGPPSLPSSPRPWTQ